ncbi:hypothetical protein CEXT_745981 [Caerostris extrusa]|uniref:Uncharacterized protein n=1 Tax=Caerostris extrusa TaxID=172846 RepID=A0AAV4VVG4_CAEEX|nr:hypothetical protein CEXT_745981 [Caerostris extrusa]
MSASYWIDKRKTSYSAEAMIVITTKITRPLSYRQHQGSYKTSRRRWVQPRKGSPSSSMANLLLKTKEFILPSYESTFWEKVVCPIWVRDPLKAAAVMETK